MSRFELSEEFLKQYKNKQPKWGPLGYLTYKRSYARLMENGKKEEFLDTCKRVVEGCFQIQRNHCKNVGLPWIGKKAQNSAQEMFRRMWEFKFLPPGRGLWIMGTPFVEKYGGAALNNCFAGNVEYLTKDGIKNFKDTVNTTQYVLTHKRNWAKALISSFGKQRVVRLNLQRGKKYKSIEVTLDHRWLLKKKRRKNENKIIEKLTRELKKGDIIPYQFGTFSPSVRPSSFGIARGIAFGDGYKGHLYLCGQKDSELKKWFPLSPIFIDENKCSEGALRVADLPYEWKNLPSLDENKSVLLGWLMGYIAADGHCSNGQVCLDSNNYNNIEFASLVATTLGLEHYGISEINNSSSFKENYTTYRLSLSRKTLTEEFFLLKNHRKNFIEAGGSDIETQQWKVVSIVDEGKTKEVYCATVEGYGSFTLRDNLLTGNCAFVSTASIKRELEKPFKFLMDMSMLGVGVGFDVKGAGEIIVRNASKKEDDVYVIEDSREGWVNSTGILIHAFLSGKETYPKFDYSLIREAGAPIKGFGGISAGPQPLIDLHREIINIFRKNLDKEVGSVLITDIMNMIGKCVVSGNVRRSAEIAIGEIEDVEFRKMKDPILHSEELKSHRWASNNSLFGQIGMNYTEIAQSIAKNGEPGIVWLDNIRNYGRFKDGANDMDYRAAGVNPCAEQTLEPYELCCLVETFPSMHDTFEDYQKTLKYAYMYAKTVTLLSTHWSETNAVMMRNRRIGTSQSGIIDAFEKIGRREMLNWCDKGYLYLQMLDKIYSDWLCIPMSLKKTSIKPSGSVSLLPGVKPGIHYSEAEYYIRRIRIGDKDQLLELCEKAGYPIEKDLYTPRTIVVSVPVHDRFFRKGKKQVSIWEQLQNAADYQFYWADNNVSITVTFKPEEAGEIPYALEAFEDKLKCVSLLPLMDSEYEQMPYEEITKEQYKEMSSKIKPIDFSTYTQKEEGAKFCDGDTCTI